MSRTSAALGELGNGAGKIQLEIADAGDATVAPAYELTRAGLQKLP